MLELDSPLVEGSGGKRRDAELPILAGKVKGEM